MGARPRRELHAPLAPAWDRAAPRSAALHGARPRAGEAGRSADQDGALPHPSSAADHGGRGAAHEGREEEEAPVSEEPGERGAIKARVLGRAPPENSARPKARGHAAAFSTFTCLSDCSGACSGSWCCRSPSVPWLTSTGIRFASVPACLGIVKQSTPSWSSAFTLSASTPSGSVNDRENRPYTRS